MKNRLPPPTQTARRIGRRVAPVVIGRRVVKVRRIVRVAMDLRRDVVKVARAMATAAARPRVARVAKATVDQDRAMRMAAVVRRPDRK